jgi:hypothetical protein
MRALRRVAIAGSAAALVVGIASPASAEPRPRKDEWWFPAWEIKNAVWPLSKGAGITVGVLDSRVNPHLSGFVVGGRLRVRGQRRLWRVR